VLVFDEPITLAGTSVVELRNEFVLPASVVVGNAAGTQVFTEGIDYRLVIVGSVTSIQRLIDGDIFDGQTVLVDYEYRSSGTAQYDTALASVSVSANFLQHFTAYARFDTNETTVTGGELTTPQNDRDAFNVGLNASTQIGVWNVGGGVTYSESDEEISPSTRESISMNASARIFAGIQFNASAALTKVDLENSLEDTNQTNLRVGLSGRVWRRASVRYDTVFTKDTGGTLPSEDITHLFNLQWQYRAVFFSLSARYADNALGDSLRRRKEINAVVKRFF
jgi:hypothetical protein